MVATDYRNTFSRTPDAGGEAVPTPCQLPVNPLHGAPERASMVPIPEAGPGVVVIAKP
jgi:hypothetical protein